MFATRYFYIANIKISNAQMSKQTHYSNKNIENMTCRRFFTLFDFEIKTLSKSMGLFWQEKFVKRLSYLSLESYWQKFLTFIFVIAYATERDQKLNFLFFFHKQKQTLF